MKIGKETFIKCSLARFKSNQLKGSSGFFLQLSHVLLLHLLWFGAFTGSKRIAWTPLCVKNCSQCLRNKSIWTSGGTGRSAAPPEVNPVSPLCLPEKPFQLFFVGQRSTYFLSVSVPACSSTGREAGHVCGWQQSFTLWLYLFNFIFFPPCQPSSLQRYFEGTFGREACLSNQRGMCVPLFLRPFGSWPRSSGRAEAAGISLVRALCSHSGFGGQEWLLGTSPSRRGGRWDASRAWIWSSHWHALTVSTQDQFWTCFWGKSVGV